MSREQEWSSAAVKARLLRMAREQNLEFQYQLERYALQRFLARLAASAHRGRFLLKGAQLYSLWTEQPHRPTRDLDLLGDLPNDLETVAGAIRDVCAAAIVPDGLRYDADSVRVTEIREGQSYQGVRVQLRAYLGKANLQLQIDIGFGDEVTPAPIEISLPSILDGLEPIRMPAYTIETVVAEKIEALVSIGAANSRMKDFYDLWEFSRLFRFDGALLAKAVGNTFRRRRTSFPETTPVALTAEYAQSAAALSYWNGFLRSAGLADGVPEFGRVIEQLALFIVPLLDAARQGTLWPHDWHPGGPWATHADTHQSNI
jgi:predicted nucleotidyltransferase component of viral defense system